MSEDARFDEGADRPLNLVARDEEDLRVISALAQDAVFPCSEMRWQPRQRRFALLINRFRWEDRDAATARARPFERTRALLVAENVLKVSSQGLDRRDSDLVLSLLTMEFAPDGVGGGDLTLVLAGDGALRLRVEALEVTLKDVTRPYAAPSRRAPRHEV